MRQEFLVKKLASFPANPVHPELHLFEILFWKGEVRWGCHLKGPFEPDQKIVDEIFKQQPSIFWIELEEIVEENIEVLLTKSEECSKIGEVKEQSADSSEVPTASKES